MKKKDRKNYSAIEVALVESAEFFNTLTESLEDNKISFGEAISIAEEAWDLKVIYKEWPNIINDWVNHTDDEIDQWVELFKSQFEIPGELARKRIEIVVEIVSLMIKFRDTYKK